METASDDSGLTQPLLPMKGVYGDHDGGEDGDGGGDEQPANTKNKLGTLNGAYIPVSLNVMGVILFLRLGWATGEAGIGGMLGDIVLAETMAVFTVLSFSAIVSNGIMAGGGSYYMISRSLGPEFGGAIGILFYMAYAIGVSFYIVGFAEEVQTTWFPACTVNNLGESCYAHSTRWLTAGIGSGMLLLLLAVSLKGAEFFAKFNVFFFIVQMLAILIGIISFLVPHDYTGTNVSTGAKINGTANFPHHFSENFKPDFQESDPCSNCNFQRIFAITFPMATGIMEGANLSGDLKNPSVSIPKGTLWGVFTATCTYVVIVLAMGGAFHRSALVQDLNIFQNACLGTEYIVVIGILISSASSALGSLFGGSRVLQAVARDDLFPILKPFAFGSRHGDEPRVAVMMTWVIAQVCVLVGNLDTIAPIITSFFCLSYTLTNLTCFALCVTGAPNFRPRFKYFSWHTALFGAVLNVGIMFYINWLNSLLSIVVLTLIFVYLVFKAKPTDWGDVSQELMFHQVRKYLLRLDSKTQHAKFWRPNMLVLLSDMDAGLLGFCNSLKRGGIMVLGQIIVGDFRETQLLAERLKEAWLSFTRRARLKVFPQVAAAPSAEVGYQLLMACGGLGGLNFNTLVVPLMLINETRTDEDDASMDPDLADAEASSAEHARGLITRLNSSMLTRKSRLEDAHGGYARNLPLDARGFISVLQDACALQKNILVTRNFGTAITGRKGRVYMDTFGKRNIDVWIIGDWGLGRNTRSSVNTLWSSDPSNELPNSGSFDEYVPVKFEGIVSLLVQLGQILLQGRVGPAADTKNSKHVLRLFHVASSITAGEDTAQFQLAHEARLRGLVERARLDCNEDNIKVYMLDTMREILPAYGQLCSARGDRLPVAFEEMDKLTRCRVINELIRRESADTCQIFAPLLQPPEQNSEAAAVDYLNALGELTDNLPPTALVYSGEEVAYISSAI